MDSTELSWTGIVPRFIEQTTSPQWARILRTGAMMTAPRFIRPGRTWLITRRTTRRHFLLRPDADGTAQSIYWYTTAVLAKKFGIELHAVQVLSTHIHEVLTDVHGRLPAFVRERNRALANALKRHRRWPEEFFQRAPASYVELYGAEAILRKIGYTIANCVEAGLVRDPSKWPGVTVSAEDIGQRVVEVIRPDLYFDPNNPVWPEVASLKIVMPRGVSAVYGSRSREVLTRAVTNAALLARDVARKAGHVAGSIASLLRVPFAKRSRSPDDPRRGSPTFASAGDPEQTRLAISERKQFYAAYRQATARLGAIVPWVDFPPGSWRWPQELSLRFQNLVLASNIVVAAAS